MSYYGTILNSFNINVIAEAHLLCLYHFWHRNVFATLRFTLTSLLTTALPMNISCWKQKSYSKCVFVENDDFYKRVVLSHCLLCWCQTSHVLLKTDNVSQYLLLERPTWLEQHCTLGIQGGSLNGLFILLFYSQ